MAADFFASDMWIFVIDLNKYIEKNMNASQEEKIVTKGDSAFHKLNNAGVSHIFIR